MNELGPLLAQWGLPSSQPFVAVHPWTSNPVKQWPAERFQALIDRIATELETPVVVVGQHHGQASMKNGARHPRVVDLVGPLSLPQLAALLQQARLLVSSDSGPVHMAAAVGTRTVVLFGERHPGTGPRRWGPWGVGHQVLAAPTLEAISVEEAFTAVQQALRTPATHAAS